MNQRVPRILDSRYELHDVIGSGGMATMGDGRTTGMTFSGAAGLLVDTSRSDQALLDTAYVAELSAFADTVRGGDAAAVVTGEDARSALSIALAAAASVRTGQPVRIGDVPA